MEIDGISPGNGHAYGLQKVHPPDQQAEEAGQQPSAEVSGAESDQTEEDKGVIRLLQEGHFKGVSDVRLHINFFGQLAAIEAAKVQAATEENVSSVAQSVGGAVDSFLADNELTEEEQAGVTQAQEQFLLAANGSQAEPIAGLNTAFADLVTALRNLFEPPPQIQDQQPPAGDDDGTEGTGEEETLLAESVPFWEAFIDTLESDFTTAMEALTNSVNGVKVLPEFSDPNGNGVAYEKFLAIYNEMLAANTAGQNLDQTEPAE